MAARKRAASHTRQEDHDLLIELNQCVKDVKVMLTNHLKHHLLYTLMLLGIAGTAVTAVLVVLLTK